MIAPESWIKDGVDSYRPSLSKVKRELMTSSLSRRLKSQAQNVLETFDMS